MRLPPIFLVTALMAQPVPVAAQTRDSTRLAAGATVTGLVHDSIARAPLADAIVQLVASDGAARAARSVSSDSLGWFRFSDVPDGRYLLGFFHPMLDSLGLEPMSREVEVAGPRPVRADLAIPSAARLSAAVCGNMTGPDSGAVVIGIVRDARDRAPVGRATVIAEWLELTLSREGYKRHVPRLLVTTGANGWFALCNVPRSGTIALIAGRGADSTDRIDVEVPAAPLMRRELYIGSSLAVVIRDTTPRADTLVPALTRRRAGDGRLSGIVVTAVEGTPLAGAIVNIRDGPATRANDRGEWTLVGAPLGTRMLEVRAVGYYPERRPVAVVAGEPPIRTALVTLKSVLDTVMVTASRMADRFATGFAERRRTGPGRYLSPEDIARRQPVVTSDLFHMMPGLRVDRSPLGGTQINMRGIFEERCLPAIYLDGHYMRELTADDIDSWVSPKDIAGIEVYTQGTVPAEFQPGLGDCGSIVIWTKRRTTPVDRRR
jgi:hypothetical protein